MILSELLDKVNSIPQIKQKTNEWYSTRQTIITATDVSSIFNCNPFNTVQSLYHDKTSRGYEEKETPATRWGTHYEPIAKQQLKDRDHSILTIIELGLGCHSQYSHIGASPDGLIVTEDGQLWLVEIKCPYRREITQTVPYYYWLQIQTQLFVWSDLLKQQGLILKGCLYCDNQFENDHLRQHFEQQIKFDETFFCVTILPEINHFNTLIYGSERPAKRARMLTPDSDYITFLKQAHTHTQKQYRNFINHDLLLDWFNLYGKSQDMDSRYEVTGGRGDRSSLLDKVIEYLRSFKETIDCSLGTRNNAHDTWLDFAYQKKIGLSRVSLLRTYQSLSTGHPIICNATIYDPINNRLGHYDIIIKNSALKIVFPTTTGKITFARLGDDPDAYTFIQIKYCHLKLCNNNTYVLNSSKGHKEFKMEQIHLHQVLENLVIKGTPKFAPYSFVLGCYSSYFSKGITYENFNSLNSLGIVVPHGYDRKYLQQVDQCSCFLSRLWTEGHRWSIDPPDQPELYPNMKNRSDTPWRTYKTQLAYKNKELTLLWNLGPTERAKLKDVTRWDQLKVEQLKWNRHYRQIITNMLSSNVSGKLINLEKVHVNRKPIEFYVDFEFVNQHSDLSQFPICRPIKYIYMIGCLHVNHNTGQTVFRNYMVNRLNKEQEQQMIPQWIRDMLVDNQENTEINIYHWGNAEKSQIESYLQQHPLKTKINLHMNDLCELFKTHAVTLPNCWSYNLKDVSKSLHQLGIIKTIWTTKIMGDDTITSILNAEQECQKGTYPRLCDVPAMHDILQYNYVDCKVLEEIVGVGSKDPQYPITPNNPQ